MGKKCCVPYCYSGYNKYNERYPMYGVPKSDFFLKKWQDAIARADRQITPNDSVCQRHFLQDDFSYRRLVKGEEKTDQNEEYKIPKLKPDAIPSVFPQTPDFIIGTVKKRRRHDLPPDVKINDLIKEQQNPVDNGLRSIRSNAAVMMCDTILNEEIDIKIELNDDEVEADFNSEDYVGPKKYKCHLCNYRSKWQGNVQNHQHVHLEGDQHYFNCDECKTFRTKWFSSYKSHMRTRHGMDTRKVFLCEICHYNACSKEILKQHVMRKHGNATTFPTIKKENETVRRAGFKCDICMFECDVKHTFLEHILMHRDISIERVNK